MPSIQIRTHLGTRVSVPGTQSESARELVRLFTGSQQVEAGTKEAASRHAAGLISSKHPFSIAKMNKLKGPYYTYICRNIDSRLLSARKGVFS